MVLMKKSFLKTVLVIAVPITLQSMLQSSFSMIDQIMIGQLNEVAIASIGIVGKFTGIYNVLIAAFSTIAGIMISQYLGNKNQNEIHRSFFINLYLSLILAFFFMFISMAFSEKIIYLYNKDPELINCASLYLRIISFGYLPLAFISISSCLFRCVQKASLPLYVSIGSAIINTVLNYVLIFIFDLGVSGAGIATLISQVFNFIVMFILFIKNRDLVQKESESIEKFKLSFFVKMLLPLLICEFIWSLGENVYAAIYGNMSLSDSCAMTLINPIQGLMIGALCGIASASGIIIGKKLGEGDYDEAYHDAKKLMTYGFIGSIILSVIIILTRGIYVNIYNVEMSIQNMTKAILLSYAIIAPFKVANMILGGGILRSGGKTSYTMFIDMIGTWAFGVPLGLITAFVLHLSIDKVYLLLSLEEVIRFIISLFIFKSRKWMSSF